MAENNSLTQIQTSITSGAATLTNLLNVAAGPTAVVGFIADGVFKAIKLGIAIRKAAQQARAELTMRIEAQSILRTPVVVNLSLLELQSFYANGTNFVAFPAFTLEVDVQRVGHAPGRFS